ncbi:response regulator [Fischerella thermalis CCMEE 5319]|nr:response regulator [Fischerella thermalis CCMEE 5319]
MLIVEDNIINQRLLGNILSKYGYKFDVAGNGKEAIEKATVNRYDLILMDLHMPVMDGFTCLEYIRSSNNLATTKHVKVAAVTADVMPETMERCKSAGFDMVIKKPMDLYQLINILKSLADDSTN